MSISPSSSKNAAVLVKRASSAYNASNFDQAIEHSRAALIMLGSMEDETAHVLLDEAFERLVMTYQRIGDYNIARDVIQEWLSRTKREEGRILCQIQQGRVESAFGNYDTAAQLLDDVIQAATAVDFRRGVGMAMRVRCDIWWKMGRTEAALTGGREALVILEQVGDLEQQAATHVTMAAAYHNGGQFYKAIRHLQRAARIVEQLGRQFELAIVYSNLGETYAEIYAMDKALEAHEKALELVGIDRAHPDLIRNLGVDLLGVNRREEGLNYLSAALERARRINDPDLIGQVLYSLAESDLETHQLDQAEAHGNELLEIAKRLNSMRHHIRALMILGAIARQRGDQATAQTHFNECSMIAQRSADRHTIWQTHAALHDLLRESMPQMADIHRRIAAEIMMNILTGIDDAELHQTFRCAEPVQSVLGPVS